MKKDEIIVLLKEQLQLANEQLQQANATVSSLTTQVNELIERIKSLEELLVQKGIAIDKVNRQNKALGKLVSGKKSERQEKNPQASMTQEEFDKKKTEQGEKRKARKNNGAKRDMHYEMKEVHVTIDPVMDAGLLKTLRLFGTRTCVRYSMEPIKFIKTVYHINTYTDGSILYPGKTPPALLLNSSYSPSFAAGLLQMRYIYSMPVERIIKYFADSGFTLRKATANKLIARSADVLGNFYKAICQIVLQQDYVTADETYHKVLLAKIKPTDKGSKKGYLWAVSAPKLGLVFFVYEDGSRSEQVILNVFSDYEAAKSSESFALGAALWYSLTNSVMISSWLFTACFAASANALLKASSGLLSASALITSGTETSRITFIPPFRSKPKLISISRHCFSVQLPNHTFSLERESR